MALIGRPTGWENTTHATLALPAADTLQGFVIQDDWSILASQGVPTGDHEDTWISKHTASAPVQLMIALGAAIPHPGGLRTTKSCLTSTAS